MVRTFKQAETENRMDRKKDEYVDRHVKKQFELMMKTISILIIQLG